MSVRLSRKSMVGSAQLQACCASHTLWCCIKVRCIKRGQVFIYNYSSLSFLPSREPLQALCRIGPLPPKSVFRNVDYEVIDFILDDLTRAICFGQQITLRYNGLLTKRHQLMCHTQHIPSILFLHGSTVIFVQKLPTEPKSHQKEAIDSADISQLCKYNDVRS